jgi:hypothetical protein
MCGCPGVPNRCEVHTSLTAPIWAKCSTIWATALDVVLTGWGADWRRLLLLSGRSVCPDGAGRRDELPKDEGQLGAVGR